MIVLQNLCVNKTYRSFVTIMICYNDREIKKQSFPENEFKYFEL